MNTFYLVRHGTFDSIGDMLVGRAPGTGLNATGRREAERLAEALAGEQIQRIFSSPLDRCRQTAAPAGRKLGLNVAVAEDLNEVDFGEWTGRTFSQLDKIDSWKQWNAFRSGARPPGGETMLQVQSRVVGFIQKLRREFPGQKIALFGHGDPLRSALLYFLGIPAEFILRLELSPASVSVLALTDWDVRVLCLNARLDGTETGAVPWR